MCPINLGSVHLLSVGHIDMFIASDINMFFLYLLWTSMIAHACDAVFALQMCIPTCTHEMLLNMPCLYAPSGRPCCVQAVCSYFRFIKVPASAICFLYFVMLFVWCTCFAGRSLAW